MAKYVCASQRAVVGGVIQLKGAKLNSNKIESDPPTKTVVGWILNIYGHHLFFLNQGYFNRKNFWKVLFSNIEAPHRQPFFVVVVFFMLKVTIKCQILSRYRQGRDITCAVDAKKRMSMSIVVFYFHFSKCVII